MSLKPVYFDDPEKVAKLAEELKDSVSKNGFSQTLMDKCWEYFQITPLYEYKDGAPIFSHLNRKSEEPRHDYYYQQLAGDMIMRKQLREDLTAPFHEQVYSEHQRRKWQLARADQHFKEHEFPDISMTNMHEMMAVGADHIMLSMPTIVPYRAQDGITYDSKDKKSLGIISIGSDTRIEDLHGNLGFFKHTINESGTSRIVTAPVILIDSKILAATKELEGHEERRVKTAAARLLPGLRGLYNLGMHDYVHQCIYPVNPDGFNGKNAPLRGFGVEEFTKTLHQSTLLLDKEPKLDNVIARTAVVEFHAELLNRDLWRETFRENPNIKKSAIKMATQFMCDLQTVCDAQRRTGNTEFADNMAAFLTPMALSRFFRVIEVNDPALDVPMKLRDGNRLSFIQSCNQLQLPDVNLSTLDVSTYNKSETAHEGTPELFRIMERQANRFPNLSQWTQGNSTHPSLISGFENAVARTFFVGRKRMARVGMLYDFRENDDPKMPSLKIASDIAAIYHTANKPEFTKALKAYHEMVAHEFEPQRTRNT